MDLLPAEILYVVLGKLSSLDDLGALWLTNRRIARLCGEVSSKTLWAIAYRHRWANASCSCKLTVLESEDPSTLPFRVRAWLYRRASRRAFGRSEESLAGCSSFEESSDLCYVFCGKKGQAGVTVWDNIAEWRKVWRIFQRHLVMQRVQRVNRHDPTVKAGWRRMDGTRSRLDEADSQVGVN